MPMLDLSKIMSRKFYLWFVLSSLFYSTFLLADLDDFDPKVPDPATTSNTAPISKDAEIKSEGSSSKKKMRSEPTVLNIPTDTNASKDRNKNTSNPQAKTNQRIQTKPDNTDSSEPIHWKSKSLKAAKEKGVLELNEDVVVTQGTLELKSQNAKIFKAADQKEVQKILVIGNVRIQKDSDLPEEKILGTGNEAVFFNSERVVILKGNAKLIRGSDVLKGRQIRYELDTGWISVDNVEGVMQPSENEKIKK